MYVDAFEVKWFDAGLKLGLDQNILEAIQKSHHSDEECFVAMLKQMMTDPNPPTVRELFRVLQPKITQQSQGLFNEQVNCQVVKVHQHYPATDLPVHTDLPTDDRQQLIATLQEQTLAIQKEFTELVTKVMQEYQKCKISPNLLVQLFGFQSCKDLMNSVADVFIFATAESYLSFYNYDRLKSVTTLKDVRDKQQEYDTHFGEYCKIRLRKFPSDGAAVEEKVVFLMDNKMGLQRNAELELRQLQSQVSEVTGFRVSKLVWIEDDLQEPTLGAELNDKGEGVEESCSVWELDSAPTLPQPGEPCPPLQRYLKKNDK